MVSYQKTFLRQFSCFFFAKRGRECQLQLGTTNERTQRFRGSTALQDGRVMFLVAVFVMFLSFGDADIRSSTARSAA